MFEKSSGNVFKDLGLESPEQDMAKAELLYKINSVLERRKLTQLEAAKVLGVEQDGVLDLVKGRMSRFTADSLVEHLNKLNNGLSKF